MNNIIFIIGGSDSGKSIFAEKLALKIHEKSNAKKIAYIATSEYVDKEMKNKILIHQKRRGKNFKSYEENLFIDKKIHEIFDAHNIFLLECIATWLGNIFHNKKKNPEKISFEIINNLLENFINLKSQKNEEDFTLMLRAVENKKFKNKLSAVFKKNPINKILIIVSSEVNLGIIPDNKLSREYKTLLGKLNQYIADKANFVYFLISGNPIRLK